jgi:hypothetical protein
MPPILPASCEKLRELLEEEAEFLEPVCLGDNLPETDGVIFPEMLGQAYREVEKIKNFHSLY